MARWAGSSRTTRPTARPITTLSATGRRARSINARRATRRSSSLTRSRTPSGPEACGSAAEAADHVVEDRQAPAQRIDRDALVDAMEPLEEALLGVEPQR